MLCLRACSLGRSLVESVSSIPSVDEAVEDVVEE